MDAVVEKWYEPDNFDQAKEDEAYQKQTNRLAELALKRYNKNKDNKVNPFWLIGAYAPTVLKSFSKMSKNSEQKFLACI
jgi:hypothetical protein